MNVPTKSLAVRLRSMCKFLNIFTSISLTTRIVKRIQSYRFLRTSSKILSFITCTFATSRIRSSYRRRQKHFNKTRFDDPPPEGGGGGVGVVAWVRSNQQHSWAFLQLVYYKTVQCPLESSCRPQLRS